VHEGINLLQEDKNIIFVGGRQQNMVFGPLMKWMGTKTPKVKRITEDLRLFFK
jgi:hypothetical protein